MSIILLNLGDIWIGISQKNTSFPHPTIIVSNCRRWTRHAILIIFHINDASLNIDLYKDANNSTNFPQTFFIIIVREVFNCLQFTIYFRKKKKKKGWGKRKKWVSKEKWSVKQRSKLEEMFFMTFSNRDLTNFPKWLLVKFKLSLFLKANLVLLDQRSAGTTPMVINP